VSRSPQARGQRALLVSTVSPAISGRVLTCAIGVDKTPKFLPNASPVTVLRRLGFYPASKFSRVNRLDVSEDGTYFRLEAPPGEPQLGQAVGVFPRLSAVLFFGRAKAEKAAAGKRVAVVGPPSSNSFLSRGHGGALNTLERGPLQGLCGRAASPLDNIYLRRGRVR
jgi:hypothetical protein